MQNYFYFYRAKGGTAEDLKEKLLRLLLAQSSSLLLGSGCPLDEVSLISSILLLNSYVIYASYAITLPDRRGVVFERKLRNPLQLTPKSNSEYIAWCCFYHQTTFFVTYYS